MEHALNQASRSFQKLRNQLHILGVSRMTRSSFRTEDPHTLRATVQSVVAGDWFTPGLNCLWIFCFDVLLPTRVV
jgi:hypothetical protein